MANVNFVQTNFTAGALSPRLFGRTDINKYQNGAQELRNFLLMQHGGIIRRSGTKFVHPVRNSADNTILVPFEFSTTDAYIIELGDLYARFYKSGAIIKDTGATITAGSWSGGTATLTIGSHTHVVSDRITVSGATPSGYDGTDLVVTGIAATTVSYAISSDPGAWSSGGTVAGPYQITTQWAKGQLDDLQWAQSADVMFFVHPDVEPREIARTADTSWTDTAFDYIDGPWLSINTSATTMNPSATTGSITITASVATFAGDATDVGRLIRISHSGTWGYAKVTAHSSTTVVTALVVEDFGASIASDVWRLGAWSDVANVGWPEAIVFHQQRLWFGATVAQPQTVWATVSDDFTNFQPSAADGTVADDDGIAFTIATNQVNKVEWLASTNKGMVIGTSGGEFTLQGTGTFSPITPTTVGVLPQTYHGGRDKSFPILAGSALLFAQRQGRKIREFKFNFDVDTHIADDLTLLAEHLTTGLVKRMSLQQEPFSTIWVLLDDGSLLSLTYERGQDVVAWAEHVIGGTTVAVKSIATIPDTPFNQTWAVVSRTIDGGTKQYVEYLSDVFQIDDDKDDSFFVDSGITYSGSATTTITGLDHLEGESVAVLANGATHPNKTVASGSITLDRTSGGNKVHVGLGYTSLMKTLPLVPPNSPVDPRGKRSLVYKMFARFHNTLGASFGRTESTVKSLPFRGGSDPMDESAPLFTGIKEMSINTGYQRDPQLVILQDQPLPMTILSVVYEMDVGGVA